MSYNLVDVYDAANEKLVLEQVLCKTVDHKTIFYIDRGLLFPEKAQNLRRVLKLETSTKNLDNFWYHKTPLKGIIDACLHHKVLNKSFLNTCIQDQYIDKEFENCDSMLFESITRLFYKYVVPKLYRNEDSCFCNKLYHYSGCNQRHMYNFSHADMSTFETKKYGDKTTECIKCEKRNVWYHTTIYNRYAGEIRLEDDSRLVRAHLKDVISRYFAVQNYTLKFKQVNVFRKTSVMTIVCTAEFFKVPPPKLSLRMQFR